VTLLDIPIPVLVQKELSTNDRFYCHYISVYALLYVLFALALLIVYFRKRLALHNIGYDGFIISLNVWTSVLFISLLKIDYYVDAKATLISCIKNSSKTYDLLTSQKFDNIYLKGLII
jgi:hypothetical protein